MGGYLTKGALICGAVIENKWSTMHGSNPWPHSYEFSAISKLHFHIFPFLYACVFSVLRFLPLWERLLLVALSLLNLTNALTITNNRPPKSKRPKRAYLPPAENNTITSERKIYAPINEARIWNIHLIFRERSSLKIKYLPRFFSFFAQD